MREVSRRWLDRAEEDLYALSALDHARAPNAASVLCQQAVEKMLKACWVELGSRAPLTHELEELWTGIEAQVGLEISHSSLDRLTPYGTQARYITLRLSTEEALWAVKFCLETCAALKSWLEARP
jgi:HEPN domain-containing protein